MTRLWIMSDLHQEWAANRFDPLAHAPDSFDVVVVAGDVDTPGDSAIDRLADWFPGTPVVYVPGNHDFYVPGGADPFTWLDMQYRMRDRAYARGVHLLMDDDAYVHGVRFLGATLWTDMRLGTWNRGHAYNTARRGMNDYHAIRRRRTGRHHDIRVQDTVDMHAASRAYLTQAFATPYDGPTVVVTHHAPSARSLPDAYMDLRWAYASALDDMVAGSGAALWVHGHLHNRSDYDIGDTRVIANPRGHDDQQRGFDPSLVVTL